jgi:hypothetical protein
MNLHKHATRVSAALAVKSQYHDSTTTPEIKSHDTEVKVVVNSDATTKVLNNPEEFP